MRMPEKLARRQVEAPVAQVRPQDEAEQAVEGDRVRRGAEHGDAHPGLARLAQRVLGERPADAAAALGREDAEVLAVGDPASCPRCR
jgi:hypothetical protein